MYLGKALLCVESTSYLPNIISCKLCSKMPTYNVVLCAHWRKKLVILCGIRTFMFQCAPTPFIAKAVHCIKDLSTRKGEAEG